MKMKLYNYFCGECEIEFHVEENIRKDNLFCPYCGSDKKTVYRGVIVVDDQVIPCGVSEVGLGWRRVESHPGINLVGQFLKEIRWRREGDLVDRKSRVEYEKDLDYLKDVLEALLPAPPEV
jgi:DNA-directed RNA polymerase subunit RPC12/RpoP